MRFIQIEIKYLKSAVRILMIQLKKDMNQIFQIRYFKTFNDNLQQSYRLSKFWSKLIIRIAWSLLAAQSWQNLKAFNFVDLQSARLHSISFERSTSHLFGRRRSRSQQDFKDNLSPHEQSLLYSLHEEEIFFLKGTVEVEG